jgi:hypothetical protein
MSGRRLTVLPILAIVSSLTIAGAADAATLKLACSGKGPRNADSSGTVLCAGSPGKGRTISGTVRNDAGQPVAGALTLTYQSWTPVKVGYNIVPTSTRQVVAGSDGTFSFHSDTATKESIVVDLAGDPTLGIAAGVRAQADVSRQLTTKLKKLGGGRVRITTTGTDRPLKVYVLDASGYPISGVKPKKADRRGRATFNVGSRRGQFSYYVDAGVYDDLFWVSRRPTFRL